MPLLSTRPFLVSAYPLYGAQIVLSTMWISVHSKVISMTKPVLRLDVMPDSSFGTVVIPAPQPQFLDTMALSVVALAVGLACIVHFVWWMSRVLRNAHRLRGKRPMKHKPGAWAWSFVPLAGVFMPIVALYEAWTISDPNGDPERSEPLPPAPLEGRVPHSIGMWWAVLMVSLALLTLAQFIAPSERIGASLLSMLAYVQLIVAGGLTLAVLTMFARRQEEAAARLLGDEKPNTTAAV